MNNSVFSYQLPEEDVREIETLDNELCLSRGHNLSTEFNIKLYWECRLDLMNQRIIYSRDKGGKSKFYTSELKRIKKVISNVLTKLESDFRTKAEYYTGKKDYKIQLRGKDKYYYNLLTFLNYDYALMSVNTQAEIKKIIATRKKLETKQKKDNIKNILEKYPECIAYDVNSTKFNKCIEFKTMVDDCKQSVLEKLKTRDISNKFECKQQAIEKYPDYMALYNSEYTDLKNEKTDEFNINRKKQEEKEKRLAELNKLMSGPRLSNVQLINLRKFEEQKCLLDKELENSLFKLTVAGECENLLKNAKEEFTKEIKGKTK